MSIQINNSIIKYVKTLPSWQKILASASFKDLKMDEANEIINIAISRFKYDLKLSDKEVGNEIIQKINELKDVDTSSQIAFKTRLLEVSEVEGVNALSEKQSITFAPKLTIVYGDNGSGKSGYSRLLNNAFL